MHLGHGARYFLCTSMLTFYIVKIGRVKFFAKQHDRARAELAIVPVPIMQIIVVVMFAFVRTPPRKPRHPDTSEGGRYCAIGWRST